MCSRIFFQSRHEMILTEVMSVFLYSFLYFYIYTWSLSFFLRIRITFFHAGLWEINFLRFYLCWNVLISFSHIKDIFPGLSMLCCHHLSFRDLNILSIAFWLLCFYLKVSWLSNWINVWSLILSTLDAFLSFSFSCFFQKLTLKGLDVLLFVFALPGTYKYFCIFELISIIPF